MFASIIAKARTAVIKYKAQRVKNVVAEYIKLSDANITAVLPIGLEFYRRSANIVVDKTFENPAPAIALLDALGQVTKHYGPALGEEFKLMAQAAENAGTSVAITKRVEALVQALKDLESDINK